jgi:hypothetical protein
MRAKTASLIAKIVAAVIVIASWVKNQFFGGTLPMREALITAGGIVGIFSGIDLNLLAEKFSKAEKSVAPPSAFSEH